MGMKYNSGFSDIVSQEFIEAATSENRSEYSFEIDPDFAEPQIRDTARYMKMRMNNQDTDYDFEDRLLHACLFKRTVTIFLDGVSVGAFTSNNMTDGWDAFEPLRKHPLAFSIIQNAAMFSIIKKYTSPLKKAASVAGT